MLALVAIVPLVARSYRPASLLNLGYWVGGGLLLIAVMLSSIKETANAGNILALCGSALVAGLFIYGIRKFIALRLAFTHGPLGAVPFARVPVTPDQY